MDVLSSIFRNSRLLRALIAQLNEQTLRTLRLVNREFQSRLDDVPEHFFPEYDRMAFRPDVFSLDFRIESGCGDCVSCRARESAERSWSRKLAGEDPEPTKREIGGWPVCLHEEEVRAPRYLIHCSQQGWQICDVPITEPQPTGTIRYTRLSDWQIVKTRSPACLVRCPGCRNHRIKIIREHPLFFLPDLPCQQRRG